MSMKLNLKPKNRTRTNQITDVMNGNNRRFGIYLWFEGPGNAANFVG